MTDETHYLQILDLFDEYLYDLEQAIKETAKRQNSRLTDFSHLKTAEEIHQEAREAFHKRDFPETDRLLLMAWEEIKMGTGEVEQLKARHEKVRGIVMSVLGCEERSKLAGAVVKATAAVYAAKAQSDATPQSQDLKTILDTARRSEREAVHQFDEHVKQHGCTF